MYSLYAVSSILVSALLECGSDSLPCVPRQCSGLGALGTYYPLMQRHILEEQRSQLQHC